MTARIMLIAATLVVACSGTAAATRPGDDCWDEGALTVSPAGDLLVCVVTQNGRWHGGMVWQLAH